jgi:RNA polymerase sigma factor (TIGR02999 family)
VDARAATPASRLALHYNARRGPPDAAPAGANMLEANAMSRDDITQILRAVREGGSDALQALLPLVYGELRAMAHRNLSPNSRDVTLDTTALVHEAYIRLFDRAPADWQDRRHFFSVAAIAMRQIIVDHARRRGAAKRGGSLRRLDLEDASHVAVDEQADDIVALHDALLRLSQLDERLARIVELRFFGGLSVAEVAEVMDMSERTVKRDWRKARALLLQAMSAEERA